MNKYYAYDREYNANYKRTHKEQLFEYNRQYSKTESGKESKLRSRLKFRQTHPEYYREYYKNIIVKQQRQRKLKILTHYGKGKAACVLCGENRIACLSIDHINNDGYEQRKQMHGRGSDTLYRWLETNNYPTGYQTLCMNCQFIKRKDMQHWNTEGVKSGKE